MKRLTSGDTLTGGIRAILSGLALVIGLFQPQASAQIYDTNAVMVQTFAGSGFNGYLDGQGAQTMFSNPNAIVSDTMSNLFVWDSGNARIRKITPDGTVTTFVGGGSQYEGYGTNFSFSTFNLAPTTFAIDRANKIWFVANFIGTVLFSVRSDSYVSIENGGLPSLSSASGICFDSANNLYYSGGTRIYRYNPLTGVVQVFAGSGNSGTQDGNGVFCSFSSPGKMAVDYADNIYVMDNNLLRRIDQGQNVVTITNLNATPASPVAVDSFGNIVLVGGGGNYGFVARMTVSTNLIFYAGTPNFSAGGYTNGPGNLARFSTPSGACLSQGSIFVADSGNHRIRQISFNPQPGIVSDANLGIRTYPGITVTGVVGRTYQIQSSPGTTNWTTRTTVLLRSSPYLWIDESPITGTKFYRAVLLP